MKILNTIIQLRRDNENNYPVDYVPRLGEVLLIDTPSKGLQAKVGNGTSTFRQLDYYTGDVVIRGYYYDNNFYEDYEHTILLNGSISRIYIDAVRSKLYTFDGSNYNIVNDIPTASSTEAGVLKLYDESGTNVDGTMTQKAITEADTLLANDINTLNTSVNTINTDISNLTQEVNSKFSVSVDLSNEMAIFEI